MFPKLISVPRLCKHHLNQFLKQHFRKFVTAPTSSESHVPRVCVVGSGPAGFYTAQQLLKGNPDVLVDIYEKLPVPFGLVRFGVAPDHPEVKNVINTFTKTAQSERCSFIGNVEVGRDVTLQQLRDAYSAVVLAYGADDDKALGVPGEDLDNVVSARSFVGWFNGLPQDRDLKVDLSAERAVILGQGNVALDVARILLTPVDILKKTDISQHALDALSNSSVKEVLLVGRRGPLQVAFTIKELREMIKIPDCWPNLTPEDYLGLQNLIPDLPRPRRRLTELLYKTAHEPTDVDRKLWANAKREWKLRFLRSPLHIYGETTVKGIRFAINRLEGDDLVEKKAVLSKETEDIDCGLVLRSIGYRSVAIDKDIPFNFTKGVISHTQGRVEGITGVYCSGWVNTGPVGVILTTMTNGFDIGKTVIQDLSNGVLEVSGKQGKEDILPQLQKSGIQVVHFSDWRKIDEVEVKNGKDCGKPREKFVDIDTMLKIASSTV
ncbi:NADPH:adrenodoxin oxidoreductase, mitochondrial-like [Ylistrum balloti]|uniref:NADPH:adrenodoxin oxidoreductase, mitochondrial-like n=1 Tax=Ylistrum balloti TaxID=509963 RepID=UPI002905BFFD|nr:NADPH:adrenodoxin oxidoreductase, mitochondrial-like [Ylistrum balloti]XP_060076512.1 NADPH:adrenodoxin oxidoreductase, mitochondrial-like [Ylistrum balloti]